MTKSSRRLAFATAIGLLALLTGESSHATTSEWRCPSPSNGGSRAIEVRVDTDPLTIVENGTAVPNGPARSLPDLAYFTRANGASYAWGALNTRTGAVYYSYLLDTDSGTLTYAADGLVSATTCIAQSEL